MSSQVCPTPYICCRRRLTFTPCVHPARRAPYLVDALRCPIPEADSRGDSQVEKFGDLLLSGFVRGKFTPLKNRLGSKPRFSDFLRESGARRAASDRAGLRLACSGP